MLKNYFLLAWRNLLKHRASSIINISGLAIGLMTSIVILLYVADEFSYDRFHGHLSEIYLLMKNQQQADGISTGASTAGPVAAALRKEMPSIRYAAREAGAGDLLVRVGKKTVYTQGMYADVDLFKIMSFPVLKGNAVAALSDPSTVALTESAAKRIFGTDEVMGKVLVLDDTRPVKVAAVLRDPPVNSSVRFEMVLSFQAFEQKNDWLKKWDDNRIHTWVQVRPSTEIAALNRQMTRMLQTRAGDTTISMFAFPLADMRLHAGFQNGRQHGGAIYTVSMVAVLGLFVLLIACINFMNISTARSEQRAKEVGVRKVMGATRKVVIGQFLCEALLMTFFALVVGVLLSRIVLPLFNHYANKNIRFEGIGWTVWLEITGIGLVTGLIAGSYPALFLSRYKPARVLKGQMATGKKGSLLRNTLVTAQFWVSIFFIIGTIVIFRQISYVRDRPIGYDQENLVDIRTNGKLADKYQLFLNALSKMAGVTSVSASSDNLLQYNSGITGMDWPGKTPGREISILITNVAYNWTRTSGLKVIAGRDFSQAYGTDTAACLINRATIAKLGLKEPVIGQKLGGKAIIGVVEDFVYNNPSGTISPLVFYLSGGRLGHFFVRIKNDNGWRQTMGRVEQTVKALNPGFPFESSFTKEEYQSRFDEFTSYGLLAMLFGGMAIFISCLGLFGLSAFVAERRSREMSIRKVFGASAGQVWILLSAYFLKPVLIAFVLVVPFSLWVLRVLLSNIVYHVGLSWWMFGAAGLVTLCIALLTVSYQGVRTAIESPVRHMRNE